MKTLIFASGCALVIVVIGAMLFFNFSARNRVSPTASEPLGSLGGGLESAPSGAGSSVAHPATGSSAAAASRTGTLEVHTTNGGSILVSDFMASSSDSGRYSDSGNYFIGTPVPSAEATGTPAIPPYSIVYMSDTQYFNIELLKEPIASTRREAEQYLMKRLGITEEAMCALDYTVSVPWRVNPVYTSMSLGFSFCPGSEVLPGR